MKEEIIGYIKAFIVTVSGATLMVAIANFIANDNWWVLVVGFGLYSLGYTTYIVKDMFF